MRPTTTSDDVVIVTRLIAIRGVGVSPSLSRRSPLALLSRFLSFAILDTSARHLSLSFSLYSLVVLSSAHFFQSSRRRSSLISPPASFSARNYTNAIEAVLIDVDMPPPALVLASINLPRGCAQAQDLARGCCTIGF